MNIMYVYIELMGSPKAQPLRSKWLMIHFTVAPPLPITKPTILAGTATEALGRFAVPECDQLLYFITDK